MDDGNGRRMTANASPPSSSTPELASIKVFCRLRQQNQLEKREGAMQCSTVVGGRTMFLRNERCEVDEIRCTFDRVFDIHSTQEEVYTHTAKPLVHEFLQGYNCTIFAYGQTGSGKTHTILGPKDGVLVSADEEGGIISRVVKDLYEEVERAKSDPIELKVSSYNMAETISTLRFGLRAKEIKNPVVQRTDGGEGGAAFAAGTIFKELYQRAMEDMEAKNRKIDELQRLLTAKLQENQHPDEVETDSSGQSVASVQDSGKPHASDEDGDNEEEDGDSADDDDDEEEGDEEENDPAQSDAKNITKLELANQALEEENKRLFGVLEALEKKLDEVTVDLSTGRPILTLSSQRDTATEGECTASGESREAAAPSLKVWLESDNWRKSLAKGEDLLQPSTQPHCSPEKPLSTSTGELQKTLTSTAQEAVKAAFLNVNEPLPLAPLQGTVPPCSTPDCVHHADAEALSRQIVDLKLQLHYLSENARLSLSGESYSIVLENARLKTRIEELEFQANLCNVACSQLEMKNRACETRLSNQETHIGCLQNSLQEYQGLFKQQIIMSQEKCRLLTDELEFYKKLARCSQESYQHLGGSTSPGRRNKGKSPSPRKTPSSSNSNGASNASSRSNDAQHSSCSVWPNFGSLIRTGSSSSDVTLSPLTARAQRFIVKPTGERASSTAEQIPAAAEVSASSQWRKTSVVDLSLSLDELAQSATLPASPVASPSS
ncbi:hypothetical protein PC115_g11128 [Phytophthora cactorum]|uniref:Kinesin motor domain-containing protein n=1 Tax=Phytophthora cactorum TaxID=29920 RepID=A0A8T1C6M2_9STRA|nr:hypothetical protein PC115_g11128 [Phytophthora cactorum]KAG3163341.1 hypothetical protein C6341_g12969 [Phytophthora cactorum]